MKKQATYDDFKELIELHTTAINAKIQAGDDLLGQKMDEMIKHQKETNGRVKCLEKETKFARLVQEYPKISVFVFIIIVSAIGSYGIPEIINLVKSIF